MMNWKTRLFAITLAACATQWNLQSQTHAAMKQGNVALKSAGPIAFNADGILFIGDTMAASVVAVETQKTKTDTSKIQYTVSEPLEKIAAALGTTPGQIRIIDIAAHPSNGTIYLSVIRGQGAKATPIILQVDSSGKFSEFSLKNVKHDIAPLPNPPEDKVVGAGRRKQNNRQFSITDIAFVDGRLVVAGLSNEQFASNLRTIPFPFTKTDRGSSIEIFHGAHGRLETRSPIRTFVPIVIDGNPQLIAAYTCTPLVRIPLSDLKAGTKVTGTTIAELGNRNRPLDIIAYKKDGKRFLLMANSARGVMKISTDDIDKRKSIDKRISGLAGQTYETITALKDVTQLDRLNDTHAIILIEGEATTALRSIELP
jgi:hypothetical protein